MDSVLLLGNSLRSKNQETEIQKKMSDFPSLGKLVSERFGTEDFPLERLKKLSPETLGGAYAKFLGDRGLEASFYKNHFGPQTTLSDHEYLVWRARQTHDIWHVVSGFDTTQEGEAGLMAFYYAQMRSPLSALLVGLSFIHFLLRRPQDLPKLFEEVTRGWTQGLSSHPLIVMHWEGMWETPLADVQKQLQKP